MMGTLVCARTNPSAQALGKELELQRRPTETPHSFSTQNDLEVNRDKEEC